MAKRFGLLLAVAALAGGSLLTASAVSALAPNTFTANLSGAHEVPPVATGTGTATITIAPDGSSISYTISYSGLSGPVVAAHIHIGAIGQNGPIILPFTVGPSPMTGTLTAANFTGANGLTYAQGLDAIRSAGTYVNLHTAAHPGGEIRGQLFAAGPQSYLIAADAPEAVPAGHNWGFNDFFPRTLKVAQGSVVEFAIKGFHTATLLPTATSVADDLLAHGIAGPDSDDSARNPNGTTKAVERIGDVLPNVLPSATCGTADDPCPFDGTHLVSTGPGLGNGPPGPGPAIRLDAAPGTYVFHCRVHPEMTGSITVVAAGGATDTPEDAATAAGAQVSADAANGSAAEAAAEAWANRVNQPTARTKHAWAGYETPDHHVDILEMIPAKLTVRAGDRVMWHLRGRNEPHTVTFPTELHTDAIPLCEGPNGTDTPATPTRTPPQSPLDFACNGHPADEFEVAPGNAVSVVSSPATVSDSGLLTTPQALTAFGLPPTASLRTWSVRLTAHAARGIYHYVCQIHGGMQGEIVVGS